MKVIVNPTYRGNGWFDTAAKISFVKDKEYEITEDMDLVHVNKHLALGYLLEVKSPEEVKKETLQPIVASSSRKLLNSNEEADINGVQEEEKEEIVESKEETVEEVVEEKAKTEETADPEKEAEAPKTKKSTTKKPRATKAKKEEKVEE